ALNHGGSAFVIAAPRFSTPTMDFDADFAPTQLTPAGRLGRVRRHDGRAAIDLRVDPPPARRALACPVPARAGPRSRHRAPRLLHLPPADGPDVGADPRARQGRRYTHGPRT